MVEGVFPFTVKVFGVPSSTWRRISKSMWTRAKRGELGPRCVDSLDWATQVETHTPTEMIVSSTTNANDASVCHQHDHQQLSTRKLQDVHHL
eukprot:4516034-Amphidinium_carterae.1